MAKNIGLESVASILWYQYVVNAAYILVAAVIIVYLVYELTPIFDNLWEKFITWYNDP
jgi:hypothetical protein